MLDPVVCSYFELLLKQSLTHLVGSFGRESDPTQGNTRCTGQGRKCFVFITLTKFSVVYDNGSGRDRTRNSLDLSPSYVRTYWPVYNFRCSKWHGAATMRLLLWLDYNGLC